MVWNDRNIEEKAYAATSAHHDSERSGVDWRLSGEDEGDVLPSRATGVSSTDSCVAQCPQVAPHCRQVAAATEQTSTEALPLPLQLVAPILTTSPWIRALLRCSMSAVRLSRRLPPPGPRNPHPGATQCQQQLRSPTVTGTVRLCWNQWRRIPVSLGINFIAGSICGA